MSLEILRHISNKNRSIRIIKATDASYAVTFICKQESKGCSMNESQYNEFRLWLNNLAIKYFDIVIDTIVSRYIPGHGWERNWTWHIRDALQNQGIQCYTINTLETV